MSEQAPEPSKFGRYTVNGILGEGAMGTVYKGEDPVIGRQVAIKVVRAHTGLQGTELEARQARFEREFRSAGLLAHPNIVTVYDVGQEGGLSFIAMELVPGDSLDNLLTQGRLFTFKEIADIVVQVASALDYAHERGIVHRDIKPGNILMTVEGRPKITDFGVAKLADTGMTTTGAIIGTPRYMSPEQITGHPVSGASDQFSLAVVVYEMLTRTRPFDGENPTTIMYQVIHEDPKPPGNLNGRLPPATDAPVLRGLAKEPEQRFPSCSAFAEAVRSALGAMHDPSAAATLDQESPATVLASREDLLPSAPAEAPAREPAKGKPRRGRWAVVGAVVALVLAVAGWGAWKRLAGTADERPAPVAAAAAQTVSGALEVSSDPPGVSIWVDGEDVGLTTPAFVPLEGIAGEVVELELRREGEAVAETRLVLGQELPQRWTPEISPPSEVFQIVSDPPGASVTLDGERLSQPTPVVVTLAPGESHRLRLELDGHEPLTRAFSLEDLASAERSAGELAFRLQRRVAPGYLQIVASYPVRITVDGSTVRGERIALRPGSRSVRVAAPEVFFSGARNIEAVSGETYEWRLPQAVTVTVAATPGNCRVSIDGRDVGYVPAEVQLTVGLHEFEFTWAPLGKSLTITEDIGPSTRRVFRAAPRQ